MWLGGTLKKSSNTRKKKKKKKALKRFSSSNVIVGYLCVQSLPECLCVYWKGREPSWKTGVITVITQLSGIDTVES